MPKINPSPENIRIKLEPVSLGALHYPHEKPRHRILALHGWLDNAATFNRLLPSLTEDESVALDFPGHGHSDWLPPGLAYHFVDTVTTVVDTITALNWDRCVLMGHSLGAGVAPLVAAMIPERISGLILIDGLGPQATPGEEAPEILRKALADRSQNRTPRIYPDKVKAVARLMVRELTEDAATQLAERGLKAVEGGWQFSHDPRLTWTSRQRMTEAHVEAFFREIACPTLLFVASRGPIEGYIASLSARLACIREVERIDLTAGHHLHLEQPELLLGAIEGFLSKIS